MSSSESIVTISSGETESSTQRYQPAKIMLVACIVAPFFVWVIFQRKCAPLMRKFREKKSTSTLVVCGIFFG